MTKQYLSISALFCCAWLFFGCGKPSSAADLYGNFVADYKVASEKLVLNRDGTFAQEVTIKGTGKVNIATGAWSYDPKKGYIRFDETFMSVLNGFREFDSNYARPKVGKVVTKVGKVLGQITIGTAEGGIIYKKL